MKKNMLIQAFLIAGIVTVQAKPLPKEYLRDSFPALERRCRLLLDDAYMTETLLGETTALRGWEGFPVKLYEYRTGTDVRTGTPKTGRVYLLNPSPRRLAMWIATTCWEVRRSVEHRYTDKLLRWIRAQSGAQFPVRGVVYEAMYEPGRYDPYVFMDGVTVYVADSSLFPADGHCTPEQLDFYLRLGKSDLKPYTGRYARICSTTREQYKAGGGRKAVGDSETDRRLEWLDVVRRSYRKAWRSDRNELMIAWARENL